MSFGTGAATLQALPPVPFSVNPAQFAALTRKRVFPHFTAASPGSGGEIVRELPQSGLISALRITFAGQVVVATAADEASNEWPYGLLSRFKLNVNGQTELFNVEGEDLHVLRYLKNPSFEDATDVYPGQVGGGTDTAIGTHPLHLTWVVPIAMDPVTLVGSLFAQTSATQLEISIQQALAADLFETPANCTLTGNWTVEIVSFDIPRTDGALILPDVSRLHAVNSVRTPVTNTGENRLELIRSSGLLSRLLISGEASDGNPLSAHPSTPAARKLDALSFEYGSQERPYRWNPAATLVAANNEDYGGVPPYDRLVLDTVRYNSVRDGIHLQGLTEAAVVVDIGDSVTLSNGYVRMVQETLFAAQG